MNQKHALFSFQGRMRRRDYWLYSIPVLFLLLPTVFYAGGHALLDVVSVGLSLLSIYTSLALNMKRLKDRNTPTFWILFTIIPVLGPLYSLIDLGILEGTKGPNSYGDDPKRPRLMDADNVTDNASESVNFKA